MLKKIIYYISLSIITAVVIIMYMFPIDALHTPIDKGTKIFITSQEISPDRCYVAAWRNAKQNYIDPEMNGQDWYRWKTKYIRKIKNEDDLKVAVNTMLQSLDDPFSTYLKGIEYTFQDSQLNSTIGGIGINIVEIADKIVIANIIQNGPAQKAGLKIGDIILKVDDKDTSKMIISKAVEAMRGNANTIVKLEILRSGKILKKNVTREYISVVYVNYKTLKNNIGYIQIANFMGNKVPEEFLTAIKATNNLNGLIIDLRGNRGGTIGNAIAMLKMMINKGNIVTVKYREQITFNLDANNTAVFKDKPIIILVNRGTASAAEVFSGALRYHKKALLIGESTYGKNTIQQIIPMQNHSGMNLTIAKYYTPDGKDIHNVGLEPDYYVPFFTLDYDEKLDPQLNLAQKIIKNEIKNKR